MLEPYEEECDERLLVVDLFAMHGKWPFFVITVQQLFC